MKYQFLKSNMRREYFDESMNKCGLWDNWTLEKVYWIGNCSEVSSSKNFQKSDVNIWNKWTTTTWNEHLIVVLMESSWKIHFTWRKMGV